MADVADQGAKGNNIEAGRRSRGSILPWRVLVALSATFVALCNVQGRPTWCRPWPQAPGPAAVDPVGRTTSRRAPNSTWPEDDGPTSLTVAGRDIGRLTPRPRWRKLLDTKIQQVHGRSSPSNGQREGRHQAGRPRGLAKQYDAYQTSTTTSFDIVEAWLVGRLSP